MPSFIFDDFFEQLALAVHDFSDVDPATGYYMLLLDSQPLQSDSVLADLAAREIAEGGGYAPGGLHLADIFVTEQDGVLTVDAASDPTWDNGGQGANISASYMAIYRKGTHKGLVGPLVLCEDFGGVKTSENAPFTYQINENGFLKIQRVQE